ncbi:hypothetical protein BS47DRAFT_1295968 [Hydnum rufescens UP504]|uniref:Uncharacterized protein n=1 Tax=Hydnum rufescens UP504 TaxID=1448309 RepID=A0A9P6DWC3_9AGAM|nr:hypothetical protein BS47DRAFT_1295968 [Hydnum rufescens UP504]
MSPNYGSVALPRIPAGRRWDPARGVDVFKRDNEEVLARFLKMDHWGGEDISRGGDGGSR